MESLDKMQLKRSEMNLLIMDYLVAEGFKEAAEKFQQEAGLGSSKSTSGCNDPMLDHRIAIRNAVEEGRIVESITLINEHYPELIDQNRHLFFKLQQQQLIELIREEHTEDALKFAQDQLNVDEDFLDLPELERTLALLAFDKPMNSPFSDLLHLAHRQQLASEINEAILKEESGSAEVNKPQLVTLVKLLLWTQNELEKKKIKFNKMTDLTTGNINTS